MKEKYDIEYVDSAHLYLCNGVIIPSVTKILEHIFPGKYKDIPEGILNAKAEYGTKLHNAIEKYNRDYSLEGYEELDYLGKTSFEQYLKIKEENRFIIESQEEIVNYKDCYAGRFDMLGFVENELSLMDIKTTAKLDLEYLSWQLSLYEYAYCNMYKTDKFNHLYAIWLPKKGLGQLVRIERKSEEEIINLLKEIRGEENVY